MNGATAIRQELKSFIDVIPDHSLYALKPLLSVLAETESLVIETDLTDEEIALIDEGRRNRKEHPENFTPWAKVRKG
jgi:hypothetical protein